MASEDEKKMIEGMTKITAGVRKVDSKLVVKNGADDPDGGPARTDAKESVELFNLKDDPYEKTNLAAKHPEKVKELKATLAGFAKQAVPPKAKPKPPGFVAPKVWGEKN